MKEYRAINGVMLPTCDDPAVLPKGNDGDFFYLVKGTEDLPTGIYRVNGDGTYTHNGTLPFSLRASLTEVDKVNVKIEKIEKEGSKISEEKISKQEESLADLKETVKKLQTIESSKEPDFEDPYWSTWIQYRYDYSVPSGVVKAWIRTPGNDALSFPNTWNLPVKIPTISDATQDPTRTDLQVVMLPQNVRFRFAQTPDGSGALSCDISFPADTFSGIGYQLVDASKTVIPKTPRAQSTTATDVAAGLGWATVPANAKFAQFRFVYKNGGDVPFEFPLI